MKNLYSSTDEQIISMLTPKVEVKPSADMRERILKAAEQATKEQRAEPKPAKHRISYWLGAVASAAAMVAVAIIMTVNSPAYAARKYFSMALIVMQEAKSMIMEGKLRTEADESIDYINPQSGFVPTTIKVIYDEPMLFSIEKKGGRTVLYKGAESTGNYVYQWSTFNNTLSGWKSQHTGYVNGELEAMLNPRLLLETEYRIAERNRGTDYEIIEVNNMVIVRVTTSAQGDYSQSDYMLNTSLAEANTLREYTFDKDTGLLHKLRIVIMVDDKPITIMESESIDYNKPLTVADLYDKALFDSITFNDMSIRAEASSPLIGIEADEAAEIILKAMNEWDTEILNTAMYYFKGDVMKIVEERYRGLEVKSIEKAVKSGLYPGRFVKCKVVLPNGKKETLTLALRNDNKAKVWLVDGGL